MDAAGGQISYYQSNIIQSYDVYLIISTMMNNDVYTTISAKPINTGNNTSTAVSGTIASIPVGAYLTTSVNTPVSTIVSVPVSNSPIYLYLFITCLNSLFFYSLKRIILLTEKDQLYKSSHVCLTIYPPMLKV